jgi:hypothetical protein
MSVERPELQIAFKYRGLTNDQRQAIEREYKQLESKYRYTQATPVTPERQQALAQMERRAQELSLMWGAQKTLRDACNEVRTRAGKIQPAVDPEISELRADIAQAMRGASRPVDFKEPAPDFSKMDNNEYRNFIRKEYGIAGF